MKRDFSRASLYQNGALNPQAWRPVYDGQPEGRRPVAGDLVAWRYGAWRVQDVRPVADHDLTEKELGRLEEATARCKPDEKARQRELNRPWLMVIRHESGPLLLEPDWPVSRIQDGSVELGFRLKGHRSQPMVVLPEPYQACSCHGHIWPCQEIDQAAMAAHAAKKMDRQLATTEPGVCAACLEAITTRQKTVTFPEESRLVPGAPGPTFHAGRAGCWHAAEKYERTGRLADNPDVVRLASCPGIRFVHDARDLPADQRAECTAGPLCSGQHGPAGYRAALACWHQIAYANLGDRSLVMRCGPATSAGFSNPQRRMGTTPTGSR